MSEETTTNEETTTAAVKVEETHEPAAVALVADMPEHAKHTFHVVSNLEHDMVKYPIGSTIEGKLMTEAQFKVLRRDGILKYASEVEDAATLAATARAKEEQLREQQAEIESLRRQLAAAQRASKKL